jgi:hypothetical protein
MINWIILFSTLLPSFTAFAQQPQPDTLHFSFSKTDWHTGDTVYLHSTSATSVRRFFNKNLRGIYHGDTLILGRVNTLFYIDSAGKLTGSCYEETAAPPELIREVLRVTKRLSQLPLLPTMVAGKPVASAVTANILFRKISDLPPDPTADLMVELSEVQY